MHRRIISREAHRRLLRWSPPAIARTSGDVLPLSLRCRQEHKSTVAVVSDDDRKGGGSKQQDRPTSRTTPRRRRLLPPVVRRTPVVPHLPLSPTRPIVHPTLRPDDWYPPYAFTGHVPAPLLSTTGAVEIPDPATIDKLRASGSLARRVLELACRAAKVGTTTDEIDALVHETLVRHYDAYPSPLNYMGFPKSVCSSVNEVICHGIPDQRPLQFGDVVSFDVSCYLNGVHGDNCGTIIVGDDDDDEVYGEQYEDAIDDQNAHASTAATLNSRTTTEPTTTTTARKVRHNWLGQPQRTVFASNACREHFATARSLVQATLECLEAGISTVRNGSCLSEIGAACHAVADAHGLGNVSQYRGHGIGHHFHVPPFVSHVRNTNSFPLRTDMVFTIEPMLCQYSANCTEWAEDGWTVTTADGGLAAQFEHMVRVTEHGAEILTTSDE